MAGKAPVRRSRFIVVTGTGNSTNRVVDAMASAVAIRSSIGEMGLARSRTNPGMLRLSWRLSIHRAQPNGPYCG